MSTSTAPRRTPLYDLHVAAGARLVDFAGWEMPVQYEGVAAEHQRCARAAASSTCRTWGRSERAAPLALAQLQLLLTADVAKLEDGGAQYALMCLDDGGVVDDLISYRLTGEDFLTVTNVRRTMTVTSRGWSSAGSKRSRSSTRPSGGR